MPEVDTKILQLLQGLLDATNRREVPWQEAGSPHSFAASVGGGVARVTSVDGDNLPPIRFEVFSSTSSTPALDTVSDFGPSSEGSVNVLLYEVYEAAQAYATGKDELIDNMLDALKGKDEQ